MYKEPFLGIVRHAMTAFGGWLAGNGFIAASDVEVIVGAVVTLAGVGWSVAQKRKTA